MSATVTYETVSATVVVPEWFPDAYEAFGPRLRAARLSRNMSQPQLAEAIGTTETRISRFENGALVPRPVVIAALALALDVTMDQLVMGKHPRR